MRTDITPIPAGAVYRIATDTSTEAARGIARSLGLRIVVYGPDRWLARPTGTAALSLVQESADGLYPPCDHVPARRAQLGWASRVLALLRRPISIL